MNLFFKNEETNQITAMQRFFNILLVSVVLTSALVFAFYSLDYTLRIDTIYKYRAKFIDGFIMTIILTFFSLFLSVWIGSLLAFSSKSRFLPLYYFSKAYVEIIRGTPLLVQIYLFFYIIATALHLSNRYVLGVVILSIFAGAYISEIIRAGIESIDNAQIETARSLGFTSFQRYRYIIIPQVFRRILPPLAGQLASLIKDSSLLSVIAVAELTKNVQEIDSFTFATFENYIVLAILYLMLTMPISYVSKILERKFNYEA